MSENNGSLDRDSAPESDRSTAKRLSDCGLLVGLLSGDSDAVERAERHGQSSLLDGKLLPAEYQRFGGPDVRETLAAWGVKFLGPVEDDPLFVRVEIPAGWKVVTENEFWSSLHDDKGRIRASIFYKAVGYDRRAQVRLCCRFRARVDGDAFYEQKKLIARAYDGAEVIHEINGETFAREYMKSDEGWADASAKKEQLEKDIQAWLTERYPDHANEGAYWE